MIDETNEKESSTIAENLTAVGQMIIGEAEKIGGILTGDPITNAEGDYNIGAGAAHQEVNREILAADETEEKPVDEKR